ncbi:MAG: FAD-dependent oxidoreductase [Pseudomonadaceae bacterium]|nr:MAG: FAD-dependent oxidoreductase [Pseudomonadaceae bacterium]
MSQSLKIAIIGAGLSGISAARSLVAAGHAVVIFDKSRGSGGRLSSKRTEFGQFDMGAQYFTARDHSFRQELKTWLDARCVEEWTPRLYQYDQSGLRRSQDNQQRFVGYPRMTAWSRALLEGLELVSSTRIEKLQAQDDGQWLLLDDQQQAHGPFARVVVATPAPQAVTLLEPASQLAHAASQVEMLAGWTLALSFNQPLDTPMDACFVREGPIDWISRNSSKPGRDESDTWVIQSTPAWAQAHIDSDKDTVASDLLSAFAEVLSMDLPTAQFTHVHRWLYARPGQQCEWGALAAPELGLYACGDWCLGGRVENAWLSGQQAAKTLLSKH